jgi:hypothetical protein
MLTKLAQAVHDRQVTSDHNRLIREANDDVVVDDVTDDEIDVTDLDTVMDNDGDSVTQEDLDQLEGLIGTMVDKAKPDIAKMTIDEVEQHVAKIQTPTIQELDQ